MNADAYFETLEAKLSGDGSITADQVQWLLNKLRDMPLKPEGGFERRETMGLFRSLTRDQKQAEIAVLMAHVFPDLARTKLGQNLLAGTPPERGPRAGATAGAGARANTRPAAETGAGPGPGRGAAGGGAPRQATGDRPQPGPRQRATSSETPPRGPRAQNGERPQRAAAGAAQPERPRRRPDGSGPRTADRDADRGPGRGPGVGTGRGSVQAPAGRRDQAGERPAPRQAGGPGAAARQDGDGGAQRGPRAAVERARQTRRTERATGGERPARRARQAGGRGQHVQRGQGNRNRFGSKFPRSFEEFVAETGPIPDSFDEVLDLDYAKDYAPSLEAFQTRYQTLLNGHPGYGHSAAQQEEFLRRLRWGHNFYRMVRFVRTHGSVIANRNPDLPDSDKVKRLAQEVGDRMRLPDMGGVLRDVEDGRSISIIGVHQGYHWLNKTAKDQIRLPRVHITKSGAAQPIGDDIVFKAENADPTAFLKLIKDIRKRQVLIELHPDGRNGETVRKPLMGAEVAVGVGFTTLSWHAKASVYSLGTTWDGEQFIVDVKKEPDPRDFEDSQSYGDAAVESYVEMLRTAYLETPENLRLPRLITDSEDGGALDD